MLVTETMRYFYITDKIKWKPSPSVQKAIKSVLIKIAAIYEEQNKCKNVDSNTCYVITALLQDVKLRRNYIKAINIAI